MERDEPGSGGGPAERHGSGVPDMTGVEQRPVSRQSLAHGVTRLVPGTLVAQAIGSEITVGPREGRAILFGRLADEVHVCVGGDDRRVSRQHGLLTCRRNRWWVRNTGRLPVRLPSQLLFTNEEPVPLAEGYTALFVQGSGGREHLLEVYVVGPDGDRPRAQSAEVTYQPRIWPLSDTEQLALIVLGQRYLLHEPNPQPLSWQQAADQLAELQPAASWGPKRLEHIVVKVRDRLSRAGVAGLRRDDVPGPVGNVLNDNLLRALVHSTTLVPTDLDRLDRLDPR